MNIRILIAAGAAASSLALAAPEATSQEDYLGEVMLVGFNFCPRGTLPAEGQLLSINQNTALFSLYGTIYGGDGRTTFALPDLRGRAPVHHGSGPGLSSRQIGSRYGAEMQTIDTGELPQHTHSVSGTQRPVATATQDTAGVTEAVIDLKSNDGTHGQVSAYGETGPTGSNMSFPTLDPSLVMNYCIATTGVYPSRN